MDISLAPSHSREANLAAFEQVGEPQREECASTAQNFVRK